MGITTLSVKWNATPNVCTTPNVMYIDLVFFFGCSIGLYPRITARILDLFECVSYSIVVVFVRFFQLQEKIKCTETYIDLLRTRRNLYSMIVVFFPPVFEFKWVLNFHQALAEA